MQQILQEKGISSHIRSCRTKAGLGAEVATGRRMSTSLPLVDSENVGTVNQVNKYGGKKFKIDRFDFQHNCSKCELTLKTVQALKIHEKFCKGKAKQVAVARRLSTTLPINNVNSCDICGDVLPTPTSLKVHKLLHRKAN